MRLRAGNLAHQVGIDPFAQPVQDGKARLLRMQPLAVSHGRQDQIEGLV